MLQRSVTLIRRLVCVRPSVSTSGALLVISAMIDYCKDKETRRRGDKEIRSRPLLVSLLVSLSPCLPLFSNSRVHPLGGAIYPLFVFPNRHVGLERINQPLAG